MGFSVLLAMKVVPYLENHNWIYQKSLAEEVCGSVVIQHYSRPSQNVYLAPTTTDVLLYINFPHVLAHIPLHFSKNTQKLF